MKKLNLGGISAAPSTARSAHPTIVAEGDTLKLLEQFAILEPQFKSLKNQRETITKQLAAPIRYLWFDRWNGVEPEIPLGDVVSDFMHFCHRESIPWFNAEHGIIVNADIHFKAESGGAAI